MITILKLILIVVIVVGFIFLGFSEFQGDSWTLNRKQYLIIIPILLLIFTNTCYIVPANNVGIKWSMLGGTQKKTLDEGIHFIMPFDKVYTIPTTVQERRLETLTVQTKDSQFVKVEAVVKFKVDKDNAFNVYQKYGDIDNLKDKIVKNYAQKAIEKAATKYNVIELLGESKMELYGIVNEELAIKFAEDGIDLVDITIDDIDAGKDIEAAIQETAKAKQDLETAEQKKEIEKTKAEMKIIKAQGEADANAILTEKLTREILYKQFLEKWDGKLPLVTGEDGNIIDISSLLAE